MKAKEKKILDLKGVLSFKFLFTLMTLTDLGSAQTISDYSVSVISWEGLASI